MKRLILSTIVLLLIETTAYGQECLSNYFPSNSEPSRLIFVLPTVEEFNSHMVQEYKKRINVEEKEFSQGWLQKQKSYARRRHKKIQKIKKCSKEILVLSVTEYTNLDPKMASLFDFVVHELQILHGFTEQGAAFVSTTCYQYENIKTKEKLRIIGAPDDNSFSLCLSEEKVSNVEDFVLNNCHGLRM